MSTVRHIPSFHASLCGGCRECSLLLALPSLLLFIRGVEVFVVVVAFVFIIVVFVAIVYISNRIWLASICCHFSFFMILLFGG